MPYPSAYGARPLAGFGAAPQPSFYLSGKWVWAPAYNSTTAPIPRSGFVLGRNLAASGTADLECPTTTSRHSFMEIVDDR